MALQMVIADVRELSARDREPILGRRRWHSHLRDHHAPGTMDARTHYRSSKSNHHPARLLQRSPTFSSSLPHLHPCGSRAAEFRRGVASGRAKDPLTGAFAGWRETEVEDREPKEL